MALDIVQPQPRVGDDAIPVVHELALGEDRQVGQRSAVGDGRADGLLVLIDGLSAERVLYPDRVTPDRQQEMLDELLGRLHPRPARSWPW